MHLDFRASSDGAIQILILAAAGRRGQNSKTQLPAKIIFKRSFTATEYLPLAKLLLNAGFKGAVLFGFQIRIRARKLRGNDLVEGWRLNSGGIYKPQPGAGKSFSPRRTT